MRALVSLPHTLLSEVAAVDDAASDAARRFMSWLQQGLADGSLRVNEPGALVHFVDAGMLLVSPRTFKAAYRGSTGTVSDDYFYSVKLHDALSPHRTPSIQLRA